jgi:hypothetical protein
VRSRKFRESHHQPRVQTGGVRFISQTGLSVVEQKPPRPRFPTREASRQLVLEVRVHPHPCPRRGSFAALFPDFMCKKPLREKAREKDFRTVP